jgi:hypothetical protein
VYDDVTNTYQKSLEASRFDKRGRVPWALVYMVPNQDSLPFSHKQAALAKGISLGSALVATFDEEATLGFKKKLAPFVKVADGLADLLTC